MELKEEILDELGYSPSEYRKSILYLTIKKAILSRDAFQCRSRHCKNNTDLTIITLHHSKRNYLGLKPYQLLTFCKTCDNECKDYYDYMSLILGNSFLPEKSNPRIGHWHRNHKQTNNRTRDEILTELTNLNYRLPVNQ